MRKYLLRSVIRAWLQLKLQDEQKAAEHSEAYKRYWRVKTKS